MQALYRIILSGAHVVSQTDFADAPLLSDANNVKLSRNSHREYPMPLRGRLGRSLIWYVSYDRTRTAPAQHWQCAQSSNQLGCNTMSSLGPHRVVHGTEYELAARGRNKRLLAGVVIQWAQAFGLLVSELMSSIAAMSGCRRTFTDGTFRTLKLGVNLESSAPCQPFPVYYDILIRHEPLHLILAGHII